MNQTGYTVPFISEEDCIYTTNFESKLLDVINPHSYGLCGNSLDYLEDVFLWNIIILKI